MLLILLDLLYQMRIFFHAAAPLDIVVVAILEHAEASAHPPDWIFLLILYFIFALIFLLMHERKNRSSSTFIFKRLFSYLFS